MEYTIEEAKEIINNDKLYYFQTLFNEELNDKNFIGKFSNYILFNLNESSLIFPLLLMFSFISIVISFFNLFFTISLILPFYLIINFFLYFKFRKKINLNNNVFQYNFNDFFYNKNKKVDKFNKKISKLSKEDKILFEKLCENNSLLDSKKSITYSVMNNIIYHTDIDTLKENKNFIFDYLKSPLFKQLSKWNKDFLLEKFETRLKEQTFDDKINILEKKITPLLNNNKNKNKIVKNL